ncbi:MAG: CBS domain-containing protein [Methylococcales bacterium]|nr:CBS domain-containing protein [Methylococcales bacterium]MBT7411022.1 CBS domain-containing protein [Methylococcales bacterium]
MITVGEIMIRDVVTLKTSDSILKARKIMMNSNIRHLPIVDADGKLAGLVTQRDLLKIENSEIDSINIDEHRNMESSITLESIMMKQVHTVSEKDSLRAAGLELQRHKFGCLPVVKQDHVIGIITDTDFVGVAINLIEQEDEMEDIDGSMVDDFTTNTYDQTSLL